MAELKPNNASVTGLDPTMTAAAAGGDSFRNNGHCLLKVVNGGGASIDVVVDDPGSPTPTGATQFNPDVTVAVPAGETRYIGPFPPFWFNDADGKVNLTYSSTASVTVGVIQTRN